MTSSKEEEKEEEVEITALITFNTEDPLNALNDLADSVTKSDYAEDWSIVQQTSSKTSRHHPSRIGELSTAEKKARYLVQLTGPISSAEKIKDLAGLNELPKVRGNDDDVSDGEEIRFCEIDGAAKWSLQHALQEQHPDFEPLFIRLSLPAPKNLSSVSIAPMLGVETLLPQFRADDRAWLSQEEGKSRFTPSQDEYPVWYFFYGTLGQRETLARVLRVHDSELSMLLPASVEEGRLGTWGGKYNALVNGTETVSGNAFLVLNRTWEDRLREYETDNYEVVRCVIWIGERRVMGCTFRFVGTLD